MTYLLDNDISFRFAHMLTALGVDVVAVRDVEDLGEDSPDVEILQWLNGRERVFVTADKHIRSRPAGIAVLKKSGVTALFLERFWAKLDFWQQAAWLVARWPRIVQLTASVASGTCAAIRRNGLVNLFCVNL